MLGQATFRWASWFKKQTKKTQFSLTIGRLVLETAMHDPLLFEVLALKVGEVGKLSTPATRAGEILNLSMALASTTMSSIFVTSSSSSPATSAELLCVRALSASSRLAVGDCRVEGLVGVLGSLMLWGSSLDKRNALEVPASWPCRLSADPGLLGAAPAAAGVGESLTSSLGLDLNIPINCLTLGPDVAAAAVPSSELTEPPLCFTGTSSEWVWLGAGVGCADFTRGDSGDWATFGLVAVVVVGVGAVWSSDDELSERPLLPVSDVPCSRNNESLRFVANPARLRGGLDLLAVVSCSCFRSRRLRFHAGSCESFSSSTFRFFSTSISFCFFLSRIAFFQAGMSPMLIEALTNTISMLSRSHLQQ